MNIPIREWEKESPSPACRRILVVEDDELLRDTYKMLLCLESFEVEAAENGAEGLTLFKEQPFDLVLTDRNMPKMDGVGLIKSLRKLGSDVPIIMISGSLHSDPLPPDVAPEVCVALPKPAFPKEIRAAISFALSRENPHPSMLRGESWVAAA